MPDDGFLKLDNTQCNTEEKLGLFQNMNGVYEAIRLKPLGADFSIQENKI